ncbi:MAG: hypothetical protein GX130_09810 [Candidatus Hydrogenedens sp.]|nr:hypothetical protein [Candidatus Hydrogenedens sp.]
MPKKDVLQTLLLTCALMLFFLIPAQALYSGQNGKGTPANPFRISTIAHWQQLETEERHWDKYYSLQNDLDFAEEERTPVGTFQKPFTGHFTGNDKELRNFKLSSPVVDNGLFGMIGTGAEVTSLRLRGVFVGGGGSSGALAGRVHEGFIHSCPVTEAQAQGHTVGGLVGKLEGASVEDCSAAAEVRSTGPSGVLVGAASPVDNGAEVVFSSISRCEVSGGKATGIRQIGGLVGLSEAAQLSDCIVDAEVEGTDKVGGLAGHQIGGVIAGCTVHMDCSASDDVGGIAGLIEGESWIQFCSVTGEVTCIYENGGGLAGRSLEGMFNSCAVDSAVTGKDHTGGLVGKASDSFFQFCEFDGSVSGSSYTGGFVGSLVTSNIIFGEVKGSVLGKQDTGGIVGRFEDGGIQNCQVENTVLGLSSRTGGIVGYGEDIIITAMEVNNGVQGLGSHTGGLVGYCENVFIDAITAATEVQGKNMTGGLVGAAPRFTTIENANVNAIVVGEEAVGGLVGEMRRGSLSSVKVHGDVQGVKQVGGAVGLAAESANLNEVTSFNSVAGETETGGLVGLLEEGLIVLCTSYSAVKGNTFTGGIVGRAEAGDLRRSTSLGSVRGGDYTGGFVGDSEMNLDRVYSSSNVTGTDYVGGLVGRASGDISGCNAKGRVMGNNKVGGLVGLYSGGNIGVCFSEATVFAQKDSGGLIGSNAQEGLVKDCYATGTVRGDEVVGGLIGDNGGWVVNSYAIARVLGQKDPGGLVGKGPSRQVADCYWNTETSGVNISAGGYPATTAEMRFPFGEEMYADWDFEDIWGFREDDIINNGFPYLQKNVGSVRLHNFHPVDSNENWHIDEDEKEFSLIRWQSGDMALETAMRALYIFRKGGFYRYDPSLLQPESWVWIEEPEDL